jgi:sugar lactone lactonase YvrE
LKEAVLLFEALDKVGEGPCWNPETGRLYWVDISGKRIHSFDPVLKIDDPIQTDDIVTAIVFDKNEKIVAALSDSLVRIDPATRKTAEIFKFRGLPENVRLNDGKCDAAGRLWIGTMDLDEKNKIGALYRVSPDLSCEKMLDGLIIGNGLAWNMDDSVMYYIDSPENEIWAFDFDLANGGISNKRTVARLSEESGMPDGMTVDSEGMLWVAHFRGAQATRWDPSSGRKLASFPVPTYNITCPCFGGERMDELFLTTASVLMEGSTEEQRVQAGSLYRLEPGVTGKAAYKFGG